MPFDFFGKPKCIDALILRNRISEGFEVFNFEVEIVKGIVDCLVVLTLDTLKPLNDDWKIPMIS
jgi:hypothetical protein